MKEAEAKGITRRAMLNIGATAVVAAATLGQAHAVETPVSQAINALRSSRRTMRDTWRVVRENNLGPFSEEWKPYWTAQVEHEAALERLLAVLDEEER